MCDDTHIRFVDTHAESIRRHHDTHPVVLPVTLPLVFLRMLQTSMIEGGAETCLCQMLRYLTGMAATAYIDDGGAFLSLQ